MSIKINAEKKAALDSKREQRAEARDPKARDKAREKIDAFIAKGDALGAVKLLRDLML